MLSYNDFVCVKVHQRHHQVIFFGLFLLPVQELGLEPYYWIFNIQHVIFFNFFPQRLGEIIEILIVDVIEPVSLPYSKGMQTRMHRVVEYSLFVESAVVGPNGHSFGEANGVLDGSIEFESNIDGSFHDEVHLFDIFNGLVDNIA